MTIGEKIKERRLALNMTQDQLAKMTGYKSRSSIQKIETSRDSPMKKVRKFAKVLDLSVSYLMGWEDITWDSHAQEIYENMDGKIIEPDYSRYYVEDSTIEMAKQIQQNKELSLLFDTAKTSSAEDLQTIHAMLLALKKKENKEND